MKFEELLEIIDPDTYVRINDNEHNSYIECDADNGFLQFASELTVEKYIRQECCRLIYHRKGKKNE